MWLAQLSRPCVTPTRPLPLQSAAQKCLLTAFPKIQLTPQKHMYSNLELLPWKLDQAPRGFWLKIENQRVYVQWLEQQLNIRKKEDWYNVTTSQVIQHHGVTLLNYYKGSIFTMLQHIYPNFEFLSWKFHRAARGFWSKIENRKRYIKWLEGQLNITKMEDWYNVSTRQIIQHHEAAGFLARYCNNSISGMLQHIYPEFKFLLWKFGKVPRSFWDSTNNLRQYFDVMATTLSLAVEDLKSVPAHIFSCTVINKYSLQQALSLAYPEKKWQFSTALSKGQTYLIGLVKELFGSNIDIFSGYKHPTIMHSKSNRSIELDLFIPSYQLALEYQGWQHDYHMFRGNLKKQKERDQEKWNLCQQNGILLISIPELWSGLIGDLKTTIYHYWTQHNKLLSLPFSLPPKGNLILPSNVDIQRAKRAGNNIKNDRWGKLFLLPQQYHSNINPTDWWLSEKYDGFRAMWIATEKHFKTKGNTTIIPPAFIVNQLPENMDLDGELWIDHGCGDNVRRVAHIEQSGPEQWSNIKFLVFDSPHPTAIFEERRAMLLRVINGDITPNVKLVEMEKCNGYPHLHQYFATIISKGGEGVVLRQPGSLYEAGYRSNTMLKFKQTHFSQAVITNITKLETLEHSDNPDKYFKLECESCFGIQFALRRPPAQSIMKVLWKDFKEGKAPVISFKYFGLNDKLAPLYPICVEYHPNIFWQDIVWYRVTLPSTTGSPPPPPWCYSCRKKIDCATEMRITTTAIRNTGIPELCTKSFHANGECLLNWEYHRTTGKKVNRLPVFSKKVAISPAICRNKLELQYQQQLNNLETCGISVISQAPFNTFGNLDVQETGQYIAKLMSEFGTNIDLHNCNDSSVTEYIGNFVQTSGIIYPLWTLHKNGALTSSKPDIAKVPKEQRPLIFVPSPGHVFMSVDFLQYEISILANITKDKDLVKLLLTNKNVLFEMQKTLISLDLLPSCIKTRDDMKVLLYKLLSLCDSNTLMKELPLTEDVAFKLIKTFDTKLFPSFRAAAAAIYHHYLTNRKLSTISNLPLTTVLNSKHFSVREWNKLVSEVKHQLFLQFLVLVWSKLRDNGYYDRAGVAWVAPDEAVFEVKANDKIKVLKIIKEAAEFISVAHGLSVPLQYKTETPSVVKKKVKESN